MGDIRRSDAERECVPTSSDEESPFPLTETDKWVLSQTDEEFKLHSWGELKEIISKKHNFF